MFLLHILHISFIKQTHVLYKLDSITGIYNTLLDFGQASFRGFMCSINFIRSVIIG